MPRIQRHAFHQAGHAVAAARYVIPIYRVALRRLPGKPLFSNYQSAIDYCPLHVGRMVDELRLEKYIYFLIAGSIAEMLAVEAYYRLTGKAEQQDRFRQRWYDLSWSRPEVHLDLAYYYMFVWGQGPLHDLQRWQLGC